MSGKRKKRLETEELFHEEEWREIPEYEGMYLVSSWGKVKSLSWHNTGKEQVLRPRIVGNGYVQVVLCKGCKCENRYVHRLVAEAFISNSNNFKEVNHMNECKTDNEVWNLEWCSHRYNINYGNCIRKHSRPVNQYTLGGELVKAWRSTMDASHALHISRKTIAKCCNGEREHWREHVWRWA